MDTGNNKQCNAFTHYPNRIYGIYKSFRLAFG